MTTVGRSDLPGMLSVLAGVLGGLTVVGYVAIMVWENDDSVGQIILWVLLMAAPSALAFASLRLSGQH